MTLFIVFALEDAVFKDQLQQTYRAIQNGASLPDNYNWLKDTSQFKVSDSEQMKYFEFEDNFGEFKQADQHFHFMKAEQGVLILNSSKLGIITRVIDDILLLLLFMLLPTLLLTCWFSAKLSEKALSPFNRMYRILAKERTQICEVKAELDNIEEQDIQLLSKKLIDALEQQNHMLQTQIAFNQGMAHEIRTPLQVMSHSMELIGASEPTIRELKSYHRLENAISRMHRISSALLWLTSNAQESHTSCVIDVIERVLGESHTLLEMHQINVKINECDQSKPLILPVPEIVLELVVLNLLTNVVHHSQAAPSDKYWRIDIDQSKVSFCNPNGQNDFSGTNQERFGLGLQLVKALMQRFNVAFTSKQNAQEFSVQLSITTM